MAEEIKHYEKKQQSVPRNLQRRQQWFDRSQCGLCKKKGRVNKFCEWCGLAWCDKCKPEKCGYASSYDDLWQTVLDHVKEVAEEGWEDDDDGAVRKPTDLIVERTNLAVSWCKEGQQEEDAFSVPVVCIDPFDCHIRLVWEGTFTCRCSERYFCVDYSLCYEDKEAQTQLLKKVQETLSSMSKNH